MIRFLERLSVCIQKILQGLLIVISLTLLFVNIAQIAGRNLFFYSLPWSEQLSTWLFIWSIFLGFHLVIKEDAELKIEALHFSNQKGQLLLDILRDAVSLFVIVVFFTSSLLFLQNSLRFPQKMSSMPINMYVVYSIMPVSFFLMALQKLTNLAVKSANLRELVQGGE